jgi:ornithine carbamoyltransferase
MLDLDPDEVARILEVALAMKRDGAQPVLRGQSLALLFEKPSLRTRVSFDVAATNLGARAIYLGAHEVRMGEREPVSDVARVLSRMVHGIAARTFEHATITELAEWADVPVINALSDHEHPCQALADLLTLREHFGSLRGLRFAYFGEGNNVARSLAFAAVLAGIHLVCASPEGFSLAPEDVEVARALEGGGTVSLTSSPEEAASAADVLYTDVWASMGNEDALSDRLEPFAPFQLNARLVGLAAPTAVVMHDLPAHRGEEITDDVIESGRAIVFDQAENRLHVQQALLALLMGDEVS